MCVAGVLAAQTPIADKLQSDIPALLRLVSAFAYSAGAPLWLLRRGSIPRAILPAPFPRDQDGVPSSHECLHQRDTSDWDGREMKKAPLPDLRLDRCRAVCSFPVAGPIPLPPLH